MHAYVAGIAIAARIPIIDRHEDEEFDEGKTG
jgi:hypothetical protein